VRGKNEGSYVCFLKQWNEWWMMWRIKYWIVGDNLRMLRRICNVKHQVQQLLKLYLWESIWWDNRSYQGRISYQESANITKWDHKMRSKITSYQEMNCWQNLIWTRRSNIKNKISRNELPKQIAMWTNRCNIKSKISNEISRYE